MSKSNAKVDDRDIPPELGRRPRKAADLKPIAPALAPLAEPAPAPISMASSKTPSSFRVDPRAATLAVQKVLFAVRLHTPKSGDEFFRSHLDPSFYAHVWVLDGKDKGAGGADDIYLLDPLLLEDAKLAAKARLVFLATCVDAANSPFLWPLRTDKPNAREPSLFNATAMDVLEMAKTQWVQKVNVGSAYAAEVAPGAATFKPPIWPAMTFDEIVNLAFKDRTITEMTHKLVQQRLGFIQ